MSGLIHSHVSLSGSRDIAIVGRVALVALEVFNGRRRVRVGLSSDASFEIDDGLKEGDIVVANAGTSLHDGDQVQPIFADEPDN